MSIGRISKAHDWDLTVVCPGVDALLKVRGLSMHGRSDLLVTFIGHYCGLKSKAYTTS